MSFDCKVYVVQRADAGGNLLKEPPVAVKLRFEDAMRIACMRDVAPAKVTPFLADKSVLLNSPEAYRDPHLLPYLSDDVKPRR